MIFEELTGKAAIQVLAQGLLGVLLFVACVVIAVLYRELRSVQNARAEEIRSMAVETAKGLANATATMASLSMTMAENSRTQQSLITVVSPLPLTVEALARGVERNGAKIDILLSAPRRR